MKSLRWIFLGLTFAVCFAGCRPEKIRKLEITGIGEFRLRTFTSKALSLDANLRVRNPYFATARVKKLSFQMSLGGQYFGSGYLAQSFEIPSRSEKMLTVPFLVDCTKVSVSDLDALFKPDVQYFFRGNLDLEKPVEAQNVELDAAGKVAAPDRLNVVVEDKSVLSVISLEDSSIQDLMQLIRKGRISLQIRNPFPFEIPVQELGYQVSFGKVPLTEGKNSHKILLQPGMNLVAVTVKPSLLGAAEGMLQGFMDQRVPKLRLTSDILLTRNQRDLTIHLRYPAE